MEEFLNSLMNACIDIAWKLVAGIVVLIIGTALIKLVLKLIRKSHWAKHTEDTVENFVVSFTKAALYILLFITLIAILGVPMASFVTVIASAGAAIALALQGSLSNFAAGILIVILKPVKLGEFVEVDGKSGTVIDVGIFYTTLKTFDNKHIIIPNSIITSNATTNSSREDLRRADFEFVVPNTTNPQTIKEIVSSVFEENEDILKSPAPSVDMVDNKDGAFKFSVKAWSDAKKSWGVKLFLVDAVTKKLADNNISIPVQKIDVNIVNK